MKRVDKKGSLFFERNLKVGLAILMDKFTYLSAPYCSLRAIFLNFHIAVIILVQSRLRRQPPLAYPSTDCYWR